MKPVQHFVIAAALLIDPLCGIAQHSSPNTNKMAYPKTNKIDIADTYFGNTINDPYRWLEDDRSAETKSLGRKQKNKVTQNYLNRNPIQVSH